ncbi:hypothetical protein SteCoe_27395 [Stentor coeruleus]|uniref:Uncharacterized protein n=1 Tax=Stentor coeruleus TaxID=5963 RepID=A0A1R2BAQ5_9CILI|nr:hypothetical protein SteCoe_27395 [Stentor coeruleus]
MGNVFGMEDIEIKNRIGVFERKVVDKNLLLLEVMYGKVDFDRKILIRAMYDSSRKIKMIGQGVKKIKGSDYFLQKMFIKEFLISIKINLCKLTDLNNSLYSDYQKSLIKSKKLSKTLSKKISKMLDKTEILVKSKTQTKLYKVLNMKLVTLKKQLALVSRKVWLLKYHPKQTPRLKPLRYRSCQFDLVTNLKAKVNIENKLFANEGEKEVLTFPQSYRNATWHEHQFCNFEGNDIDTCATLSEDKKSDDVGSNKMKLSLAAQMLYEETKEIKMQLNRDSW